MRTNNTDRNTTKDDPIACAITDERKQSRGFDDDGNNHHGAANSNVKSKHPNEEYDGDDDGNNTTDKKRNKKRRGVLSGRENGSGLNYMEILERQHMLLHVTNTNRREQEIVQQQLPMSKFEYQKLELSNLISRSLHKAQEIRERDVPKAPECFKCSKEAPVGLRYRVPEHEGQYYCKLCYNVLAQVKREDVCSSCDVKKSSTAWFRSKINVGSVLCQKCYKEEMNKRPISCSGCGKDKTTNAWVKSKIDRTKYLCQHCYRKEIAQKQMKCEDCGLEKAAKSLKKSKLRSKTTLCQNCFEREKEVINNRPRSIV